MLHCCLLLVTCLEVALAGTEATCWLSPSVRAAVTAINNAYLLCLVNEKSFLFICLQKGWGGVEKLDSCSVFKSFPRPVFKSLPRPVRQCPVFKSVPRPVPPQPTLTGTTVAPLPVLTLTGTAVAPLQILPTGFRVTVEVAPPGNLGAALVDRYLCHGPSCMWWPTWVLLSPAAQAAVVARAFRPRAPRP